MRKAVGLAAAALILVLRAEQARAAELVMFASRACPWCARFDAEIGPIYAATAEGQRAPLRRLDRDAPLPDGIQLVAPIRYTPTFVLLDDGREVGRIQGYPGAEFFFGLLGALLERLAEASAPRPGEG